MTIQTFTAGQTLTAAQMNTLQASDFNFTRNVQAGTSYTMVLSDKGKLLEFENTGSITLTIPTNAAAAFDIGDRVDVLLTSTGSLSIVGDTGVTLNAEGDLTTIASQWTRVTLIKRGTNSWVLTGSGAEVQTVEIENGAVTEAKLASNSVTSAKIVDGTIVNADINASAAIALSKLATSTAGNIIVYNSSGVPTAVTETGDVTISDTGVTAIATGVIVNADINASAAIELSKLATSTAGNIIVYNSSGVPTAVAETGDVTISDTGVTAIASGVIVDADINASAAISLSKLATGALPSAITVASANITDLSIVNADINASAAIALSKLATSTAGNIIVYNASGVPTAVAETGDVTISDTGVTAIASGVIVDADINSSAAIADTKLATISTAGKVSNSATTATSANTNSAIVARDASGNFSAGAVSSTSASVSGRFDGTSIREVVLDASVSASVVTADYSTGDIFYVGTAPSSNFTVNLTNAPTDNGKAITVVIFVTQGATGYIPNAVQVAGSAQTIKWANGAAPTPTSSAGKIDIFSFTFVRRSSAWTVFGSSNLGY